MSHNPPSTSSNPPDSHHSRLRRLKLSLNYIVPAQVPIEGDKGFSELKIIHENCQGYFYYVLVHMHKCKNFWPKVADHPLGGLQLFGRHNFNHAEYERGYNIATIRAIATARRPQHPGLANDHATVSEFMDGYGELWRKLDGPLSIFADDEAAIHHFRAVGFHLVYLFVRTHAATQEKVKESFQLGDRKLDRDHMLYVELPALAIVWLEFGKVYFKRIHGWRHTSIGEASPIYKIVNWLALLCERQIDTDPDRDSHYPLEQHIEGLRNILPGQHITLKDLTAMANYMHDNHSQYVGNELPDFREFCRHAEYVTHPQHKEYGLAEHKEDGLEKIVRFHDFIRPRPQSDE